MQFEGAVIREQGVKFAIVVVKQHIVQNRSAGKTTIRSFQPVFPGLPVVLMGQDCRGHVSYIGRPDIVKFLSRISIRRIPWKRFSI